MPTLRPDEILELLALGMFDALRGTSEHDAVECKAAPYRLQDERQRIEFAKDVSGLANANGGIILIGAATERQEMTREDVVRRVSAFERNLFDAEQYQQILATAVYPTLHNVQLRWFDAQEAGRGLVAVVVPPQPAKPYLVVKTFLDDGRRVEVLLGYFERRRAGVEHMSVHRLQTLLRDGLRFDENMRERLENIERLVTVRQNLVEPVRPPDIPVQERLNETIAAAEIPDGPAYLLGASPRVPVILRGFEQRNSELARLVAEPPQVRANGFDLGADREAHLVRGELLRSRLAGWKAIDVWRDGFVSFAAAGNEDFLCWGPGRGLRINPLVLAESCYLFVELALAVFALAEAPPESADFQIGFRRAITNAGTLSLPPYGSRAIRGERLRREAPESDRDIVLNDRLDSPAAVIAFRLLRELYLWFGFRQEEMPYVRERDGVYEVDVDAFTRRDG
jgi:hypothetical protein